MALSDSTVAVTRPCAHMHRNSNQLQI